MLVRDAWHRIGVVPSIHGGGRTTLDRAAIPSYLVSIGCPMLFETSLSLPMIKTPTVLTAIDEAAKNGCFPDGNAGMALSGDWATAIRYAAVTSSEFLRRKRSVAWRTTEGIIEVAPRRVIHDEDDELINEEFFTLTNTYELLVLSGVPEFGLTEYEERMIGKTLSTRMSMFLPTVVVLVPSFGSTTTSRSPISQYLVDNYLTVNIV